MGDCPDSKVARIADKFEGLVQLGAIRIGVSVRFSFKDWLILRGRGVGAHGVSEGSAPVWLRTFQPSGLFAARVDIQGSSPGLHAIFTGEDDTWDAWLNIPSSGFSGIVNLGGTGIKLRRGYAPSHSPKPTQDELRQQKEEEMDDYCSQVPVRHLVFMVHGIGQRLQKANLVDDVGTFRQLTQNLADLHLTSYQQERVLFIPCQSTTLEGHGANGSIVAQNVVNA
nr:phospholipase SGR2-like isoform X1 [Tanacetum cinerariifolium]